MIGEITTPFLILFFLGIRIVTRIYWEMTKAGDFTPALIV